MLHIAFTVVIFDFFFSQSCISDLFDGVCIVNYFPVPIGVLSLHVKSLETEAADFQEGHISYGLRFRLMETYR